MAKGRIRGAGGRPRQEGDRYPNGRLKPAGPNPIVVERRKAICDDVTMATCPLDAAYARGWISQRDHGAGKAYIAVHAGAGFTGPGSSGQRDTSLPKGSADQLRADWGAMTTGEVKALRWSDISSKDIAAIWDSALRDLGRHADPEKAETFAAEANRRWRALNAAMTAQERVAVDAFCVRETWPQWLIERLAGRMDSRWEDNRTLLVEGLTVIARKLQTKKSPVESDLVLPDPPKVAKGPARMERTVYVDENGKKMLEVERIRRRDAA